MGLVHLINYKEMNYAFSILAVNLFFMKCFA